MGLKVQPLSSAEDLTNEGLRDEAAAYDGVEAGTALLTPDDGSGPMQGFFLPRQNQGMVAWGPDADLSDWIKCSSLQDLFKKYVSDMV